MRYLRGLAVLLLLCFLVTGCSEAQINWDLGREILLSFEKDSMSDSEVRVVALQYKTEYENYYLELLGEDFWDREVADGQTFEDFVRENCVFSECRSLLYLQKIARERNISLSEYDRETLRTAAAEIYSSWSDDEKQFTEAGEEDIYNVLKMYSLADQTIRELIQGKNPGVSEEESRVCEIAVIRFADENTAREVSDRIRNGENFLVIAEEVSLDPVIYYTVSREDLAEAIREEVFSLNTGEVSRIISFEADYFLVRMENTYHALQSANCQKNMEARLRFNNWKEYTKEVESSSVIRRNSVLWDRLRLKVSGEFPLTNLFQIFD